MILYGSPVSPFVQRVLIAAAVKGHRLPVGAPPGGTMQAPEFLAIAPLGRIPVLALGDGRHLSESGAIVDYLDAVLDGPALIPADPWERGRAREIEAIAGLEVAAGLRPVLFGRGFRMPIDAAVCEAGLAQYARGLAALDRLIDRDGRYAIGDVPSVADLLLGPTLAMAATIDPWVPALAAIAAHPALEAYRRRLAEDPLFTTAAAQIDGLAAYIAAKHQEKQQ